MGKRQILKAMFDAMRYGTGILKLSKRKRYNPLRFIRGDFYLKRVKTTNFFK
jgi:hypothetical protein